MLDKLNQARLCYVEDDKQKLLFWPGNTLLVMDTAVRCALMFVCVFVFTCVCLMQVALQATCVGRFKGAELALEGLVVPVVRLHMSVQTGNEKNKQ